MSIAPLGKNTSLYFAVKIKVICSSFDRKMKENIIKPLINIGMDGGWKHLLEIQQTCVFGDTGDVSAPDCALKEALLALLTQMTSCITMTGTISAHSDQKGVCTGGRRREVLLLEDHNRVPASGGAGWPCSAG